MNVKGGQSEGINGNGEEKGKDGGAEDQNTLHVYFQRQHNETHQMLFDKGKWKYKEESELVHGIVPHVWK
jgi:hypothetical protein